MSGRTWVQPWFRPRDIQVYIPLQRVRRSARAPRAGPAMYHKNKAYLLRIRPDLASRVYPGFPWMRYEDWIDKKRRQETVIF